MQGVGHILGLRESTVERRLDKSREGLRAA